MKSIRRSFMYVFAIVCGLTFCGNAVLAAEMMGMVKGNLVVSGDVEVNNDVLTTKKGETQSTANSQGGRAKLKFEATTDMMANVFVGGEGAIEAKQDGTVGGGDYFFKVGGPAWNITMGRKGGEGLYTAGQDIALPNVGAVGRYAADWASKSAVGGFNLTFTPNDSLKFQVRIQNGTVDAGINEVDLKHDLISHGKKSTGQMNNQIGFRPWLNLKVGGIGITAVYETLSESAQERGRNVNDKNKSGFGLKMTGDVGAIALGVNYTSGDNNDVVTNSAGGYVTVNMMAGSFGLGLHQNSSDGVIQRDSFISYVAPLVEGAHIKVGYGVSQSEKDEANLFRVRFNYAF